MPLGWIQKPRKAEENLILKTSTYKRHLGAAVEISTEHMYYGSDVIIPKQLSKVVTNRW